MTSTTYRSNPWKLTKGQIRVLEAICLHGSQKAATIELGLSRGTVEKHVYQSRKRMGARTPIEMVLVFDRWNRST